MDIIGKLNPVVETFQSKHKICNERTLTGSRTKIDGNTTLCTV